MSSRKCHHWCAKRDADGFLGPRTSMGTNTFFRGSFLTYVDVLWESRANVKLTRPPAGAPRFYRSNLHGKRPESHNVERFAGGPPATHPNDIVGWSDCYSANFAPDAPSTQKARSWSLARSNSALVTMTWVLEHFKVLPEALQHAEAYSSRVALEKSVTTE